MVVLTMARIPANLFSGLPAFIEKPYYHSYNERKNRY
jgi:hypothetical protein